MQSYKWLQRFRPILTFDSTSQMVAFYAYLFLIFFSILGSLFGKVMNLNVQVPTHIFAPITLAAGVATVYFLGNYDSPKKGVIALFLAAIIGGFAELSGIYTGFPFGRYTYTNNWFPTVSLGFYGFFPILVPLAWVLIVCPFALGLSQKFRFGPSILYAATFSAIVDFLMEPFMTGPFRYWSWFSDDQPANPIMAIIQHPTLGHAPVLNFIGWWVVSILVSNVTLQFKAKPNKLILWIPIIHLFMVAVVGLILSIPNRPVPIRLQIQPAGIPRSSTSGATGS